MIGLESIFLTNYCLISSFPIAFFRVSHSGEQEGADVFIKIPHESDDEEDSLPRSRPLLVRFLFWFCGILMVILGVGSLIYAIIAFFCMCGVDINFLNLILLIL